MIQTSSSPHKNSTNPSIYKQNYLHLIQKIHSEKLYTGASKSQEGIGAAVIWNEAELMYELPNACSIFTAILKALHIIDNHNIRDAIIFTDSLSVNVIYYIFFFFNLIKLMPSREFYRAKV